MSDKVDFKRSDPGFRARAGAWSELDVPERRLVAVDGTGDPNGPAFAEALAALYPVAYALKFASRTAGRDYVLPPLEGLWWAEDMTTFTSRDKGAWSWTAMLMVPPWLDDAAVADAVAVTRAKGAPARLDDVRVLTLAEGRCLQTLHVGPFDAEGPVLAQLHAEVLPAAGLVEAGHHHEIYLSDLRRTTPARLRTLLRQPVRAA
ncbi:GyrI-like domain-containing protein [Demequina sp. SYSU T00039]|uniref:GyrI-like domain-containing protein n=1 Tax=Demequina lignilytica TaxID=3051663 RepID=A0AAW7M4T5_9MICO|nr:MULTISPECIES: GyrI-like domain-containing protein [unclassified Demequina]MDN4477848.1 GyrI-like domain-containing protein [Demequina sp. SYSU T00039-1]MDN4487757.1 GyrI-like domain-containing protein [Demequina sp. SYSU T00039]MDN4490860.1 GyrI-like domain-containing protein [Demequina sp. SYSU T00068]